MSQRAVAGLCLVMVWSALSELSARAADSDGVDLRIGAVVASNSGDIFDSRLASLRRQFHSLFPYTSYRLLKEERRRVHWGGRAGFDLPGGCYVLVIPKEYRDNRISLKLVLVRDSRPLVNTVVALRNEGTFLVGGPRHQDGVLIIAIGAQSGS
jgi:hypothetical protein